MSLYDRIFKPHVYTLADGTAVEEKRSRAPLILLVLIALTVLSVRITGFDLAVLVKKGSKFFDILKAMFPPEHRLPRQDLAAAVGHHQNVHPRLVHRRGAGGPIWPSPQPATS